MNKNGIRDIVEKYSDHFDKIEVEFKKQNEYYNSLINREHDTLGLILKYHIILEHYLNNYLLAKYPEANFKAARLTFYQKTNLLSEKDLAISFIKPGIIELNKIRNKISHNLDTHIIIDDLSEMLKVLEISRKGKRFQDVIEIISTFSTVASTFLIVKPNDIDLLIQEIFEKLN